MSTNIVILGDGLLGSELHKQTGWDIISRKKDGFDIRNPDNWDSYFFEREHGTVVYKKYNTIVNCIACTDTYSEDRDKHWQVNYAGVVDLTDYCAREGIKLVHISTDYLYSLSDSHASEDDVPVHCKNWYGYTKLLSDGYVQLKGDDYLLIRSTHKREPFPYARAWAFQIGNFDYVSVIADLIIKLINGNATGVYNVGTEDKTMYNLAARTKPDVIMDDSFKLNHITAPHDVTMDIKRLHKFLK